MKKPVLLIGNPTIGTDIEVFLMDRLTKEIVSAEGYVRGTKHEPFNFDASSKFFATSLDNVLAEFCIPPVPINDRECFIKHINHSMNFINKSLPENLCTTSIPAAILNPKFLQTENAMLFGCESDYNVWKRETNAKPTAENQCLRSAGFHVHVGYDNPEVETTEKAVKALDLFLSVPSVIVEPDNERRKLYGKAGAFRFKPYGFEHRVLSGYFSSTDALKGWVFDNTVKALEFVNNGHSEELEAVAEQIQAAVNTSDKVLAGNLIRQFDIAMP